jgi:glycosyltransferase involved in cell wall biosynthesis
MGSIPTVSVLVPTYQYGHFLAQAIESILNQDFKDFELLISDDCSEDSSAQIIRSYAALDSRIRYVIHSKNLGMVNNWNWCLTEAKGKYIKYVFADDILPRKDSLGLLVSLLENNPAATMASSARQIIDESSKPIDIWSGIDQSGFHQGDSVIARCIRNDRNLIGEPSAVIFRRSSAARFFDSSLKQLVDQEMWFHLLTQGGLMYSSEPLCAFRRHSAQQTAINQKNQVTSAESTRIMVRYFNAFKNALISSGWYNFNQRLFKHIYYARKDSAKSKVSEVAQARLLLELTKPGYCLFLSLHRLSKPFVNLARSIKTPKNVSCL